MTFPEVKIAIYNHGPIGPEFWYDGKPYQYPTGEVTVVPYKVAYFHFAVELTPGGKLIRLFGANTDRTQSWADNRLASYLPYGLKHGRDDEKHPDKFAEFETWFKTGLEFALVETQNKMSPEQFSKLKR